MVPAPMGALLFIGGWILLGLVVFFIAISGGPRRAREQLYAEGRLARRARLLLVLAVFVVMGVAVPALVIAGNERDDEAGRARVKLSPAQERGRELFGTTCNQCHTLKAANTVGTIGPDLDKLKPPRSLVLDAILKGRSRGQGRMPAQLLQGRDAEDVASFVAAVAGRE
jgi:mono/diheme cytochrome c family protein